MGKFDKKKTTILIFDDDSVSVDKLTIMLKNKPNTVLFTDSGDNVLKIAKEHFVDLIILDVNIEGKNDEPFQVCEKLKDDIDTKNIPVIFITEKVETILKKSFDYGGDDFIIKPIEENEFISRVEYHLKRKKRDEIEQIDIFISSSLTLVDERSAIQDYFTKKNKEIHRTKKLFIIERAEDYPSVIGLQGGQADYNKLAVKCSIVIIIIKDNVGEFTKEEWESAFKDLDINKKKGKIIAIYFYDDNNFRLSNENKIRINSLKEELEKNKQFYNTYKSIDELKSKMEILYNYIIR